jgi:putative phosphoesterase
MAGKESKSAGRGQTPFAGPRQPETGAPPPQAGAVRIGVISDNHGYLDGDVRTIFAGVTHIIHAGDVMDPAILTALREVAPVTAVAGNLDSGELAADLPREATGEVGGVRFVVSHKPRRLLKRLAAGKITVGEKGTQPDLVVWGHLHTPTASWVDGVLHLNPGTASSPEEEDDGPTVAIVEATPNGLSVQFIPLTRRPVEEAAG